MNERQLSWLERFYLYAHDLGCFNIVFLVRLQAAIDKDLFEQILSLLIKRHPLLQAKVLAKNNLPFFIIDSQNKNNLKVQSIVVNSKKDIWTIYENESQKRFKVNQSLWRILLVAQNDEGIKDIIFSFHHSIGDGISIISFIKNCLETYEKISQKTASFNSILKDRLKFSIPLDIESQIRHQKNFYTLCQGIFNIFSISWEKEVDFLPGETIPRDLSEPTKLLHIVLDKENTRNLQRSAKKAKTTIHGIFSAATLRSYQELFANQQLQVIRGVSQFSLRSHCQPVLPETEIINAQFGASHLPKYWQSIKDFWQLARECKQQLSASIPENLKLLLALSTVNPPPDLNFQPQKSGRTIKNNINISNLGHWQILCKSKTILLKEIWFYAANGVWFSSLSHWITGCNGKIFITIGYAPNIIPKDVVVKYSQHLEFLLKNVPRLNDHPFF